jgi:DNA-directed RNA polymerase specialized sigma24 family protein
VKGVGVSTSDEAGFDEFVAARSAALSRTAYLLTGDHHLAQDLVQTALLQAVKHWRRIHTSPEAYVRRAMYHQNISWWRRRKLAETSLESYDGAVPAADTDLREMVQWMRKASWPEARNALERAKSRLGERGSHDIRGRLDRGARDTGQLFCCPCWSQ